MFCDSWNAKQWFLIKKLKEKKIALPTTEKGGKTRTSIPKVSAFSTRMQSNKRRCTWFMITRNFSLNQLIAPISVVFLALFDSECSTFMKMGTGVWRGKQKLYYWVTSKSTFTLKWTNIGINAEFHKEYIEICARSPLLLWMKLRAKQKRWTNYYLQRWHFPVTKNSIKWQNTCPNLQNFWHSVDFAPFVPIHLRVVSFAWFDYPVGYGAMRSKLNAETIYISLQFFSLYVNGVS